MTREELFNLIDESKENGSDKDVLKNTIIDLARKGEITPEDIKAAEEREYERSHYLTIFPSLSEQAHYVLATNRGENTRHLE